MLFSVSRSFNVLFQPGWRWTCCERSPWWSDNAGLSWIWPISGDLTYIWWPDLHLMTWPIYIYFSQGGGGPAARDHHGGVIMQGRHEPDLYLLTWPISADLTYICWPDLYLLTWPIFIYFSLGRGRSAARDHRGWSDNAGSSWIWRVCQGSLHSLPERS